MLEKDDLKYLGVVFQPHSIIIFKSDASKFMKQPALIFVLEPSKSVLPHDEMPMHL